MDITSVAQARVLLRVLSIELTGPWIGAAKPAQCLESMLRAISQNKANSEISTE
jgi:hypothetical protein